MTIRLANRMLLALRVKKLLGDGNHYERFFLLLAVIFGHSNILKYCNRPFSSLSKMDEIMLERWNRTVKPNDFVYHCIIQYSGIGGWIDYSTRPLDSKRNLPKASSELEWLKKMDNPHLKRKWRLAVYQLVEAEKDI